MSGRLQSDALFQGLTRPAMILGVSYMYFVTNAMVCFLVFINTQSFMYILFVFPSVHLLGYLICLKEPRFMEMFINKISRGYRCVNRAYHDYMNSYDPF